MQLAWINLAPEFGTMPLIVPFYQVYLFPGFLQSEIFRLEQ